MVIHILIYKPNDLWLIKMARYSICCGKFRTRIAVWVRLILEDPTVTVKSRPAIKALFLYFDLCLNVILDSLRCSLHTYPFLLIVYTGIYRYKSQLEAHLSLYHSYNIICSIKSWFSDFFFIHFTYVNLKSIQIGLLVFSYLKNCNKYVAILHTEIFQRNSKEKTALYKTNIK
jgi:hypothetical protein